MSIFNILLNSTTAGEHNGLVSQTKRKVKGEIEVSIKNCPIKNVKLNGDTIEFDIEIEEVEKIYKNFTGHNKVSIHGMIELGNGLFSSYEVFYGDESDFIGDAELSSEDYVFLFDVAQKLIETETGQKIDKQQMLKKSIVATLKEDFYNNYVSHLFIEKFSEIVADKMISSGEYEIYSNHGDEAFKDAVTMSFDNLIDFYEQESCQEPRKTLCRNCIYLGEKDGKHFCNFGDSEYYGKEVNSESSCVDGEEVS